VASPATFGNRSPSSATEFLDGITAEPIAGTLSVGDTVTADGFYAGKIISVIGDN
jgi:hypothetical protein